MLFNVFVSCECAAVSAGASGAAITPSALVGGIVADLRGQITMALSRADWFAKWGKHFLPSIARAHQLQQCNNFKVRWLSRG